MESEFERQLEAALSLAERSLEEAFGEQRAEWIHRLKAEHDHLVDLLQGLLNHGDAEWGLRLTITLQELWFEAQHTAEGLDWLRRFLAIPLAEDHPALRASALDLAGAFALNLGDYHEARCMKEDALHIYRKCGSPKEIAYTLFHLGHLSGFVHGDYPAARALYQEGLDLLCEAGFEEGITHGLANTGTASAGMGDFSGAAPTLAESLLRYRASGSRYNMMLSLRRAAAVAAGMGQAEIALRLMGAGDRQRTIQGVSEPDVFLQAYERMLEPARRQLDGESQARLCSEGAELSLEEGVTLALQVLSLDRIDQEQ